MSTTVEIDEEKRVVTLTNQCPTKDSEGNQKIVEKKRNIVLGRSYRLSSKDSNNGKEGIETKFTFDPFHPEFVEGVVFRIDGTRKGKKYDILQIMEK